MHHYYKMFILALVTAVASACASDTNGANGFLAKEDKGRAPVVFSTGAVPSSVGESCDTAEPITTCEWADASDAIVVGTVVEVEAFASPQWGPDLLKAGSSPEACVLVQAGLKVRVSVVDWLRGETPTDLTVIVGGQTTQSWNHPPRIGTDGAEWDFLKAGETPPFTVGMTVGLPLAHLAANDTWSLFGGQAFAFTAEGNPVFNNDGCGGGGPSDVSDGAVYATVRASVASCSVDNPTDYGKNVLARRHSDGAARPDLSYAAYCALP